MLKPVEDIKTVLSYAKLDDGSLNPLSQCISFVDDLNEHRDDLKLIELTPEMVKTLKNGDPLTIRGNDDENVVLCTENQTFDVKEAVISNLMLLTPNLALPVPGASADEKNQKAVKILGFDQSYLELKPCRPPFSKLRNLLLRYPYAGPNSNTTDCEDIREKVCTFEDLLEIIQASEVELLAELERLHALEIQMRWRIVEFDYQTDILSRILTFIENSQDAETDRVNLEKCIEEVKNEQTPDFIISHVLDTFGNRLEREDSDVFYKLNPNSVCRHIAEVLLRATDQFQYEDFFQIWQQSVPSGMKTEYSQINNIAIVSEERKPKLIRYFPVTSLSDSIAERFDQLFHEKPKWTLEEIEPFLVDLCFGKETVKSFLTRYARSETIKGVKYFNSRKRLLTDK